MVLKIAWRNIWRNRGRSLVVMGSLVVGIWSMIIAVGFSNGFMVGYMADIINHDISHIQIHQPRFSEDFSLSLSIPDSDQKLDYLNSLKGVAKVSSRVLTNGMIASAKKAAGVQIRGIDPKMEAATTGLDSLIHEGFYLNDTLRNQAVIGQKLAQVLDVKVRSKVVLTFNDVNGNITSAAVRISGILKSASLNLNEGYVFVRYQDLARILGTADQVYEIAILAKEGEDLQGMVTEYQAKYPKDLIQTWKEITPELALMQEMYGSMLYVLLLIIMIALIFGIVNTMLMAVLERVRELGMLMAIGMTQVRIFSMILLETLYIGLIATPIGLFFGIVSMSYFQKTGLDLTEYSEGLASFGYDSILYPYIQFQTYWIICVAILITALLGALYPAWKAVKLRPVEALHSL